MCPKGRYGGETPPRVQELLKEAVSNSSQAKVAAESGLTRQTVQRYMKGIGEPSSKIYERLSKYFSVPVAWLQGELPNLSYEDAKKYHVETKLNNCSWLADTLWEMEMKELIFRSFTLVVNEDSSQSDIAYTINEIQRSMQEMADGWKRIFQERLIDLNNTLIQKSGHSLLPPHP